MEEITAKIINYTPHDVTIAGVTIPTSGYIARCAEVHKLIAHVHTITGGDINVMSVEYGQAYIQHSDGTGDKIDIPAPADGIAYVVSSITAQALTLKGRKDIFVPGDPIRDSDGRIIGCRGLCRI